MGLSRYRFYSLCLLPYRKHGVRQLGNIGQGQAVCTDETRPMAARAPWTLSLAPLHARTETRRKDSGFRNSKAKPKLEIPEIEADLHSAEVFGQAQRTGNACDGCKFARASLASWRYWTPRSGLARVRG